MIVLLAMGTISLTVGGMLAQWASQGEAAVEVIAQMLERRLSLHTS